MYEAWPGASVPIEPALMRGVQAPIRGRG